MSNKYPEKKNWKVPKQKYKINNWSAYNEALRQGGDIEVWISDEAIAKWYEQERVYDGTGTPKKFSNFAIIVCHEIRQVYKLPLRQCQGFINSIFTMWHQKKYNISAKRSWRKLNITVDDQHIIQAGLLTDRFTSDDSAIADLAEQIDGEVSQITADGAYDKNPVYETLSKHFGDTEIIIPPDSDAIYHVKNHSQRNRNLQEIKTFGRMNWQRARNYGKRNYSELAIQRYKRILGNKLHAREFSREKNEAMLGYGILNKMTNLGMPASYRSV